MSERNQVIFLDIRPSLEYQGGHIDKSLNFTPSQIEAYFEKILPANSKLKLIVNTETENKFAESKQLLESQSYQVDPEFIKIEDIDSSKLEVSSVISAEDFLALDESYILLDVRHPDEITRPAPEKNLITIPLQDLSEHVNQLDNDLKIYTLCGSGNRGTAAASYLNFLGYQAIIIQGGIKAIMAAQEN